MLDQQQHPSFATLLQRFFLDHMQQHRNLSPRTISAYRDTFRMLLCFAETFLSKPPHSFTLADLNSELILAFLDHLESNRRNCTRSRNARLAALRSFLKFAAHYDVAALAVIEQALSVPMKRFDRPLLGFLSREEMRAILAAPAQDTWVGQRDRALFSLLYNTGARASEVLHLHIADVILDPAAAAVHLQGKGRKQRSVPLWRSTATMIRSWKKRLALSAPHNYLFPNRGGTLMSRSNLAQRLALTVHAAARDHPALRTHEISPHTFRHTTAMHLLQAGVDINVIALWLGHETTSTTHMYIEADLSMKQRALDRITPASASARSPRYRPPAQILQFLASL